MYVRNEACFPSNQDNFRFFCQVTIRFFIEVGQILVYEQGRRKIQINVQCALQVLLSPKCI